jgi:hypothetical protein
MKVPKEHLDYILVPCETVVMGLFEFQILQHTVSSCKEIIGW